LPSRGSYIKHLLPQFTFASARLVRAYEETRALRPTASVAVIYSGTRAKQGLSIDTPTGMTEGGGDFAAWLKAEWETEDVELAFRSTGFAQIVTLTEVAENADGSFKVKYRDDAQQNDSNGGDNGRRTGRSSSPEGHGISVTRTSRCSSRAR
jgi:hypothetical protein